MQKWTLHRIHKWTGLIAGSWLLVLGLTGFLLDHRDSWGWLWQSGVSPVLVPASIEQKAAIGAMKIYLVDPLNQQHHVAGGQGGLWWRHSAGQRWQTSRFLQSTDTPQVYTALFSQSSLWLATADGLWRSKDNGQTLHRVALAKQPITAMAEGANRLYLVVDRSQVFIFNTLNNVIHELDLQRIDADQLPATISLSRLIRDLHYGRGVWSAPWSLLWNDLAGLAMVLLPLSGLLFYYLPKHWRKKKQLGVAVDHHYKKQMIRWLFRLHGPVLGLLACLPILYISITGIFLDHSEGLRSVMKRNHIPQTWQPPVYKLATWQGEIYSILAYQGNTEKLSLGTRLGLFTSTDQGQSWQRERLLNDRALFIWSLHQHAGEVFIGAMGGPNLYREVHAMQWRPVKGSGHMPTAVNWLSGDRWWIKNRDGIREGHPNTGFTLNTVTLPQTDFVPWFYFLDGLHSGLLFHAQWKWINDLFAILACLLVITGLYRWWHKKWI